MTPVQIAETKLNEHLGGQRGEVLMTRDGDSIVCKAVAGGRLSQTKEFPFPAELAGADEEAFVGWLGDVVVATVEWFNEIEWVRGRDADPSRVKARDKTTT